MRIAGTTLAILLISVPLAIFITIVLRPLWSWLEATFNIESIGHSGPAEWCYLTSYFTIVCCFCLIWWSKRCKSTH
jgi:hypothetical protein